MYTSYEVRLDMSPPGCRMAKGLLYKIWDMWHLVYAWLRFNTLIDKSRLGMPVGKRIIVPGQSRKNPCVGSNPNLLDFLDKSRLGMPVGKRIVPVFVI